MMISTNRLDRASIETGVLETARGLLRELGSQYAIGALRGPAHLDRDLGLGSLERVELLARIDKAFGTSLPEQILSTADTLDDIIAALAETSAAPSTRGPSISWGIPRGTPWAPLRDRQAAPSDAKSTTPSTAETWQEVLHYRARADGDRAHLILWEQDGEAERVSFGELYAGAQSAAAALTARGIRRGDAVALMLPTSRDFFVAFAGILLAGGVPVPIYPPVRADRIAEYAGSQSAILRNAEVRLLLTFRDAASAAKLLRPRVPSLRGILTAAELLAPKSRSGRDAAPAQVRASADDLALLQYTSGSTGDPKGVMLTHANLLANVRAIGEALAVRPNDVGVSWLPLYHDMGLIGAWLLPLYFGLPLVVLSPVAFLARPERWLWALHKHRGTLTAAPNFAYELAVRKIADCDIAGLDLSSVRAAMNGAEPVNAATLDRFAARFASYGFRREALLPVYGLAEASLAVTIPPPGRIPRVDRAAREPFEREGRGVPAPPESRADDPSVLSFVSVGAVLPNHEVRIVDDSGKQVEERKEGVLWFRGSSTTSGYFRNEHASRALFPEGRAAGWLNSGDRAYQADGEIFITGRAKDIILKAGRNLYPRELEEIAGGVAGVRKGCVVAFGIADPATGTERLVIAAETRERGATARSRIALAITEQVTAIIGLPPDAIELLPPHSIPKTSSGKLRRNHTRRLYLAGSLGTAVLPFWLQVVGLTAANSIRTAGRWTRRALELLYGVYAVTIFVLCLVPTWLMVSVAPNREVAARTTSRALRLCLSLAGCRVRVEGREHLSAPGPRVLVSNHTSYVDVLILMAALGVEYHFVAKSELHAMPFIGTFLRKLEHFTFERGDQNERLRQAVEIEDALRRGESIFVFPEGTFTRDDGVRPFHLGAFKAAASTLCPIFPVALRGTRQFLREGTVLPRPTRVTLTICPPLMPEATAQASWQEVVRLRDLARAAIAHHASEPLL